MTYFMHHYLFLAYGALAAIALASVWRDRDVRGIGWALVGAWTLSNLIAFNLSFDWRPALYPIIDLMIALVARRVWTRTGYKLAGAVTGLSLMNCIVNVSYSIAALNYKDKLSNDLMHDHVLWTNAIFGMKCLIVTAWGAANAFGWFNDIRGMFSSNRPSAGTNHLEEAE